MPDNLAKHLATLLPESIRWLERKGYIERDEGEAGIRITESGYRYFVRIGVPVSDAKN